MTLYKFQRLKVGDRVTLAVARPSYSCGHPAVHGRVYVAKGESGVVGSVNVPQVTTGLGRPLRKYGFACIDFTREAKLEDYKGRPTRGWYKDDATPRVAAWPEELEQTTKP
jgi:hypothetical protein